MKSENKEVDINEMAITLEADSDVIDEVRSGKVTHIALQINEQNQNLILESIDGNLILVIDDMPTTYHCCYLYNNGVFPYAIKSSLSFLILNGGEDDCLTRIISIDTEPSTQFNYKGADKPIVEDPNGDSCIWKIVFEVCDLQRRKNMIIIYLLTFNFSKSKYMSRVFSGKRPTPIPMYFASKRSSSMR